MMPDVARWHDLWCIKCGNKTFTKAVALRRHPTGGMSEGSPAYQCASCGTAADTGAMWKLLQRKLNRLRMEQLEAEMDLDDELTPEQVSKIITPT